MEQPISRKERERLARRQTMLDAARIVIAEKGFKRATLEEIAQRAEFGKGTIYNYFPEGKNEMLFAILDEMYSDVYAISLDTFGRSDHLSFRQKLRRYIEAFLKYFMAQQHLFVILMKEANRIAFGDEESKAVYFKHQLDRFTEVVAPAVEQAISDGELRSYPPESVAHLILGNVHGYLRHSCFKGIGGMNGKDEDIAMEASKAADFLCGILLDGLARSGEASTVDQTNVVEEETRS